MVVQLFLMNGHTHNMLGGAVRTDGGVYGVERSERLLMPTQSTTNNNTHWSLKLQSECIRKQAGRGSLRVFMNTGHSSFVMMPIA